MAAGALLLSAACAPVLAQDVYPSKPITLIVPFTAGGPTDVQYRAMAGALGKHLKQTVVVVNQPGAAGTMAPANMARSAAPDGYTLSAIAASLYRLPHIQSVSYDVAKDFTYIFGASEYLFGVAVSAESPYKTAQELVAAAKAKPGQVSVGAISNGSSGHLALVRWSILAGFQPNFIPYKGGSEITQAIVGGHLDAMSESGWGPMVQQGKLRVLAVYGEKRSPLFAAVPTMKELGWDVTVRSVSGIVGPKGMDPKIVRTLQDAFRAAMDDPEVKRVLDTTGQMAVNMDSASYTQFVAAQSDVEKRGVEAMKAAGIKLN
jgi:tripartite-type tricarboxylate transporter receptor subunit TctC